jgi:hypothetical protein
MGKWRIGGGWKTVHVVWPHRNVLPLKQELQPPLERKQGEGKKAI